LTSFSSVVQCSRGMSLPLSIDADAALRVPSFGSTELELRVQLQTGQEAVGVPAGDDPRATVGPRHSRDGTSRCGPVRSSSRDYEREPGAEGHTHRRPSAMRYKQARTTMLRTRSELPALERLDRFLQSSSLIG
jgi:hypothetical protein